MSSESASAIRMKAELLVEFFWARLCTFSRVPIDAEEGSTSSNGIIRLNAWVRVIVSDPVSDPSWLGMIVDTVRGVGHDWKMLRVSYLRERLLAYPE